MKKYLILLVSLLIYQTVKADEAAPKNSSDSSSQYRFYIDLTNVRDDMLHVKLKAPVIKDKSISYFMPKIVPGTYSISDFGRFVTDFKAFDKEGKLLEVKHPNVNEWVISDADKLERIEYWAEDTYDTRKPNPIFEPAGTSIVADKLFIINTHGFFGYFKGMKRIPFEVEFKKPKGFYGSTSMIAHESNAERDVFRTKNYNDLVDAPLMYNEPDTAFLKVGNADVLVSVQSMRRGIGAKKVAKNISRILEAQRVYLGGELPIKKYAFIIYLYRGFTRSGAYGALEHSYSSFYSLPESSSSQLGQIVTDIAAHEFFHILAPLNIHSEEIHYFDFNSPKMSRHLWFYEGVIEYFSTHVQVYQGLMKTKSYLEVLRDKVRNASNYKQGISFAEMSLKCLDTYKSEYGNVYEKGALIGLCLDIRLRELSDGKYGMIDLMHDLAKEYGKDSPFKDEEFFDKITELTYPEIREFFTRYVEGKEPLPLKEYLAKVGVEYEDSKVRRDVLGGVNFTADEKSNTVYVSSTFLMNGMGEDLGYESGDRIIDIQGEKVTAENFPALKEKLEQTLKEGDKIRMTVMRNKGGEYAEEKLKAKVEVQESNQRFYLEEMSSPGEKEMKIRGAWLNLKGS